MVSGWGNNRQGDARWQAWTCPGAEGTGVAVQKWWAGRPEERFWLEATDREDIGADLRAPLVDASGRDNWRYTLFQATRPGDIVFHYDAGKRAITARSRVSGAPYAAPIVWAARGSYARDRGAQSETMPGYRVPLTDTVTLEAPVTLESLRAHKPQMMEMMASVRESLAKGPVYFPFELSERPVRPLQGYAFKLPSAFVQLFDLAKDASAEPPIYRLSTNAREIRRHFNRWRKAMLETAVRDSRLWQLEEGIVLRNQDDAASLRLGPRTALGVDPTGKRWALQLNEGAEPGDANVVTGIAIGPDDRPFLLRQGRLRPSAGEVEVTKEQFRVRTGAVPVRVSNGDTSIQREWHVVTALDVPSEQIRRSTAAFVELCLLARDRTPATNPEKQQMLATLFGADERGGSYRVAGRPATEDRDVARTQGDVWEALAAMLALKGLKLTKPRPARRYEVDGVLVNGAVRLLIEIKCSNQAADLYTGSGQLLIYRKLMASLADHTLVLLLPRSPHPVMASAVEALGITIATYELARKGKRVKVTFPEATQALCGLTP